MFRPWLVACLGLAACLDLGDAPRVERDEEAIGIGSGSNACQLVDYGSTACATGARCRQPAPSWTPRWRTSEDPVPGRFGEVCLRATDGVEYRCGWGEVCQPAVGANLNQTLTPDDVDAVIASNAWCAPDPSLPVAGQWSLVGRHANGATTSPPRRPTDPTMSITVGARPTATSTGGAPRAYRPPPPSPNGPEGQWGPVGALNCTEPTTAVTRYPSDPAARAKEMGSWKSASCGAADPNGCNPGGDRIWYVFADGVTSYESRWTAPGPEQYQRPGIKAASRLWFLSNGWKYVERAVYVNNHGAFAYDGIGTSLAGPLGIPDQGAVASLAEIVLAARRCNVDYLSIVSHSNGVYTSHLGVRDAWIDAVVESPPTPMMTISIHNLQAAIARNAGFPGLLTMTELASSVSSDVPIEIEQWWTSGDYATWFPAPGQWLVDWINEKLHLPGTLSFGHGAAEQWFADILRPDLQAASGTVRARGRETDNCFNVDPFAATASVCENGYLLIGPSHDAVAALRYVATYGYGNYGLCADPAAAVASLSPVDCYGFHWQMASSNPMWSPFTQRGWVSRYYPGAALAGHDYVAHPGYPAANP